MGLRAESALDPCRPEQQIHLRATAPPFLNPPECHQSALSVDKVGLLSIDEVEVVSDLNENELWECNDVYFRSNSCYLSRTPADPPRNLADPQGILNSFHFRGPPEDPAKMYTHKLL